MTPGPIQVALQVADACEACGLLYLVGGSVASSLGGEPRTTLDVDMVVDMTEPDIDGFLAALGSGFYADEEAIRRAIRQRSSVNLIHGLEADAVILCEVRKGDQHSSDQHLYVAASRARHVLAVVEYTTQ